MRAQDTTPIKDKIISFLETNGPSLPVHIAKRIGTNMIFASAFLSELLSTKKLKMTNMKVGSSPIYYLPGQEEKLENFAHYLKSKEKDAYELLKQKKFLKDEDQDPAIRVALRAIKDFAFQIEKDNKLIWRYLTAKNTELQQERKEERPLQKHIPEAIIQETKIVLKKEEEKKEKLKLPRKKPLKKASQKKNEKFFNTVKEYLIEKNIQIEDIETFSKDNLILRIKKQNQEELLIAYNKKRVTEEDIIKAHKKAEETDLKFSILSLGEPAKKTTNFIKAIKDLTEIEKIE